MSQDIKRPVAAKGQSPLIGFRSRRGSLASISSKQGQAIDREALSQALDDIHYVASQQTTLTSFSDYDSSGPQKGRGARESLTGGLAGLYTRIRQTVSAVTPDSIRPVTSTSVKPESTSGRSGNGGQNNKKDVLEDSRGHISSPAGSRKLGSNQASPSPKVSRIELATDPVTAAESLKTMASPKVISPLLHKNSVDAILSPPLDRNMYGKEPSRHSSLAAAVTANTPPVFNPTGLGISRNGSAINVEREDGYFDGAMEPPIQSNVVTADKSMVTSNNNMQSDIKIDGVSRVLRSSSGASKSIDHGLHAYPMTLSALTGHDIHISKPLSLISEKSLPTVNISRANSTMEPSDFLTVTNTVASSIVTTSSAEGSPNIGSNLKRAPKRSHEVNHRSWTVVPAHLKRRVVSKEFWMKDENARDCFYCGDAFSTFRRKHHCRTCGQIFDAKCTVLVSGKPFDLPGTLRLCRPCEGVIYGSDDDESTVFSEEDDDRRSLINFDGNNSRLLTVDEPANSPTSPQSYDSTLYTPSIGLAASRRTRDSKRRSVIHDFDSTHVLARPGSTRSLKSLANRVRSSSHRRLPTRPQGVRNSKLGNDDRSPFQQDTAGIEPKQILPAFHNDNIIDPDLAAFLSDEGSEGEHPSLFSVLSGVSHQIPHADHDRQAFGSLFAASQKKGRSRAHSDRLKDHDSTRTSTRPVNIRRRNQSTANAAYIRPSPRRSRSQTLNYLEIDENGTIDIGADDASVLDLPLRENLQGKIKRSATMHGEDAPKIELNRASLAHVTNLLSQLLHDNKIAHARSWEKALLPILLQCTDDVDPDVQQGDDMDVRNYVKLKKVPGGRPGDTAYVSGVVFSKNVALKGMKRSFTSPRIVIVTFAIEYARHSTHFMSLDPILAQEKEYLRNLVGRIVALQPQVLLVQKNVSGLAMQMLQEAGVTVVYGIKESVLAAIARVTRTIMIKTVDKLSLDPQHLGTCQNIDVKTYIHKGRKRTYIFISGCQTSLGCTIVLRGATTETLRKVKRITEFMCYVVYNLRLETCLMRDEFVLISTANMGEVTGLARPSVVASLDEDHRLVVTRQDPTPVTSRDTSRRQSIQPSTLTTDGEKNDEQENMADVEEVSENIQPSRYRDLLNMSQTRVLSSSPFVKFNEPFLLKQVLEQQMTIRQLRRSLDQLDSLTPMPVSQDDGANFELIKPDLLDELNLAELSLSMRRFAHDILLVKNKREEQNYASKKRQWQSFSEGSDGNPFDPYHHQNIFVLQSLVSSATSVPCAGPEAIGLSFYADYEFAEMNYQGDCTLGQFVEDMCGGAPIPCKICGRKMSEHHQQYVHGSGQLTFSIEKCPAKIKGLQDSILMWSVCKICGAEATTIPMSSNTWKYSFGKYLELSFWSTPLRPRAGLCSHDIHKDFVRYFGFQDQCVKVHYETIEIYDVVVPDPIIHWSVNADVLLKNRLYSESIAKLTAFVNSIKGRLESINLSTVSQEKLGDASATVEKLSIRADNEKAQLMAAVQSKYMTSKYYEIASFNSILRLMDEKAIAWDEAFVDFERNFFPSETDIRNLAALQLRKIFLDRNDDGEEEEGIEMKDGSHLQRISLTDEQLQSEKARDMLTSVLHEQLHAGQTEENELQHEKQQLLQAAENNEVIMTHNEAEKAVERGDVKHLDLAVPVITTDPVAEQILTNGEAESGDLNNPDHPQIVIEHLPEPEPLASDLVDRIDQIVNDAALQPGNGNLDDKLGESKIPRLIELRGKSVGSVPMTPALLRAQTEPNYHESTSSQPNNQSSDEDSKTSGKPGENRLLDRLTGIMPRPIRHQTSLIPRSVPSSKSAYDSRVSALAKHFEQLSREFEKERLKERRMRAARMRQVRAIHVPISRPEVEVYKDATEAVKSKNDSIRSKNGKPFFNLSRNSSYRHRSYNFNEQSGGASLENIDFTDTEHTDTNTDTEQVNSLVDPVASDVEAEQDEQDLQLQLKDSNDRPSTIADSLIIEESNTKAITSPSSPSPDLELPLPKHEKSSLIKMLSLFWSERSASGWAPLEYPLTATEHVFEDSDIIVREDEPSSIISLALSCNDYLNKMTEFRQGGRTRARVNNQGSFADEYAEDQAAIESSLVSETGTHMKYSFGHGQVRCACKIFYAESFDALRRKCGISERFVESLSRSVKWDSKGGKTKSLFLKTLDDRFVIKALQEVELKAFTRCAPDYFSFMSHTLFHGVPSVIAKMLGLFQVSIKNPSTGVEFASYLLVMENLFYDHKPTRRFDLKGSMRNRKIESTGQPDEVLLDENLVETIFDRPLFVREHARKMVKAGVWNDTLWLCKQNVMDYSLMAGFDDDNKKLHVGIIDCIRTYTWDKKLENWVKERGRGNRNKPTITSPRDYRNRFRVSMMTYLLCCPGVWHEFSSNINVGGTPSDTKQITQQSQIQQSQIQQSQTQQSQTQQSQTQQSQTQTQQPQDETEKSREGKDGTEKGGQGKDLPTIITTGDIIVDRNFIETPLQSQEDAGNGDGDLDRTPTTSNTYHDMTPNDNFDKERQEGYFDVK